MEEEKKQVAQARINLQFEVTEGPIRKWICEFAGHKATDIYSDKDLHGEAVTYKVNEDAKATGKKADKIKQKAGKVLYIAIETVKPDYKTGMFKLIHEKQIKDVLDFLKFAISQVYPAVVKTLEPSHFPKMQKILSNIDLTFDQETMTWIPRFVSQKMRKLHKEEYEQLQKEAEIKTNCDKIKGQVERLLAKKYDETTGEKYKKEFDSLYNEKEKEKNDPLRRDLEANKKKIKEYESEVKSDDYKEFVKTRNDPLLGKRRLGIICKYMSQREAISRSMKTPQFAGEAYS